MITPTVLLFECKYSAQTCLLFNMILYALFYPKHILILFARTGMFKFPVGIELCLNPEITRT